jgi:hypothetical protein
MAGSRRHHSRRGSSKTYLRGGFGFSESEKQWMRNKWNLAKNKYSDWKDRRAEEALKRHSAQVEARRRFANIRHSQLASIRRGGRKSHHRRRSRKSKSHHRRRSRKSKSHHRRRSRKSKSHHRRRSSKSRRRSGGHKRH